MNNKTVGIVLNTVHKYVQDVMNLLKLSIFHVSIYFWIGFWNCSNSLDFLAFQFVIAKQGNPGMVEQVDGIPTLPSW